MSNSKPEICSFCRRPRNEVKHMIKSPDDTSICNMCVDNAVELMARSVPNPEASKMIKRPREIMSLLNEFVIGQDSAKKEVAIAVYEQSLRRLTGGVMMFDGEKVEVEKSNILLMGPTGSGKTLIAKAVARMLEVPFYVADCTKLTQAGYVGDDVESVLQGLVADANNSLTEAEWGIVFLDEFDKLARKSGTSASGFRDVTGEGVQQSLLKLIEGTEIAIPRGRNPTVSGPSSKSDVINTRDILFIAAGSFAGIEEITNRRLNKASSMGFGGSIAKKERSTTDVYKSVIIQDIEEFGLIPEVVGRLPVVTSTYELSEEELVRVLVEPKNCICKQFQALMAAEGVHLEFEQEALHAIAQMAKKRKTGARALRSITRDILKPFLFDAAEDSEISSIRITEKAVNDPNEAVIIRQTTATA